MFLTLLFLSFPTLFRQDAYVICGKDPADTCLVWVDQCLADGEKQGYEPDTNFEYCAETVDPKLVHLW
jgi:hypothetical protein